MCLAIPGKLLSVEGDDPAFRLGRVDFCGINKIVNLMFTPDAEPGDFLLVHVGFAVSRMGEEEAQRTYQDLKQIGALAEEDIRIVRDGLNGAVGEKSAGFVTSHSVDVSGKGRR